MGGHYLQQQRRLYVGSTLTLNMLLMQKRRITLLHNRLKNNTANLLKEVYHDVRIKPTLQNLTDEQFEQKNPNTFDEPIGHSSKSILGNKSNTIFERD